MKTHNLTETRTPARAALPPFAADCRRVGETYHAIPVAAPARAEVASGKGGSAA